MTKTIETGKISRNGYTIRIQKRRGKFDVIYCTGFCWKYIVKAVSEQEARNEFFLHTI